MMKKQLGLWWNSSGATLLKFENNNKSLMLYDVDVVIVLVPFVKVLYSNFQEFWLCCLSSTGDCGYETESNIQI